MKTIIILLGMSFFTGAAYAQTPAAQDADDDVIAVVLGENISVKDKDKLNGLIFGTLLDQFAMDNRIVPTDEELNAFILKTEEKERQHLIKFEKDRKQLAAELKATTLGKRERQDKESRLRTLESILESSHAAAGLTRGMEDQMRLMTRQMAQQFVSRWKVNKALYAKYGGRVIFQQAGVEPLDAYRDFLREQEESGKFRIIDGRYEASFWRYFTDDDMHTFYSEGDGGRFINTPWWMMEEGLGE